MAFYNPFSKHETHHRNTLIAYQVLSVLSWALVVVAGIYYSIHSASDTKHSHNIWKQADKHPTAFSQNNVITGIYWIILLLSQVSYVWHFFSKSTVLVTSAANVAPHFILSNLLIFAFIMLWVRNHFWPAEIILIVHVLSQSSAYWTHLGSPPFVHWPAIAGPYAWALTALFWNGAVAVHAHNLPSRIVANVFIWVIFLIGWVHIFAAKDYIFGYSLSILTLSLAVKQLAIKVIALQWIFAFVIFAVFFVGSLYISSAAYSGRNLWLKRIVAPESSNDREREPLLNNP
ncbi:hypothetical protein BGW36DRAFT_389568 [Talaromyces proteolyticus]|uniref:DUF1774-domain-containing protein n=1 Tax=Talaromyces proteolyticus TaxID=1131652 RepID=A0AAD4KL53_9EURO|nr:uncharacterized protein BGW36DRAFT_389568 [Talaromyces proteolyticus]KAH8690898.1 hypothetical protein BGW36DRAFT_389568 [Talaromyces proteolyticus]